MSDNGDFFDQLRQQHSKTDSNDEELAVFSDIEEGVLADHEAHSEPKSELNPSAENLGKMSPQARRALVSLMRYGVILATQKINLFESICRYQIAMRQHLSDVYLKLILDEQNGVAFIVSVTDEDSNNREEPEDEDRVSLIIKRTLTLYDTLLLLVLRKHYQERETSGEQKVVIDLERIEGNLQPFLPLTNNSKADRSKLIAALKKLHEKKIIVQIRSGQDRFEISPIIRYVVKAEFLEQMLCEYVRLAEEAGISSNSNPESEVVQTPLPTMASRTHDE